MEQVAKLVIESREREWPNGLISMEEIARLGEWDLEDGVVGLGQDGVERVVGRGETVEIAAHKSFYRMPFAATVEGKPFGWHRDTIKVEEIARLGGWDVSVGVIEVDEETNSERTLAVTEVIQLTRRHNHHLHGTGDGGDHHEHHHHHKSYGKKHRWKRG